MGRRFEFRDKDRELSLRKAQMNFKSLVKACHSKKDSSLLFNPFSFYLSSEPGCSNFANLFESSHQNLLRLR
jgi:hypothetical protein